MSSQLVRTERSRHTTTIDIAVLGLIVHFVGTEIEGVFEALLESAEPVHEGRPEAEPSDDKKPDVTNFPANAEIVIHIKLTPYYSVVIGPVVEMLRSRLIERIQQLTDLHVHAVHIHVAALRPI